MFRFWNDSSTSAFTTVGCFLFYQLGIRLWLVVGAYAHAGNRADIQWEISVIYHRQITTLQRGLRLRGGCPPRWGLNIASWFTITSNGIGWGVTYLPCITQYTSWKKYLLLRIRPTLSVLIFAGSEHHISNAMPHPRSAMSPCAFPRLLQRFDFPL